MTGIWRSGLAIVLGTGLTLAACADDGNDGHLAAAPSPNEEATRVLVPTTVVTAAPATTTHVPTVEPTGVVISVAALDNTFRPEIVEIRVGDEVLWENRGINDHNVLYADGDDWGVEVQGFGPGAEYAHVFDEPGEYRYFCSIHGTDTIGMIGTIIVTA